MAKGKPAHGELYQNEAAWYLPQLCGKGAALAVYAALLPMRNSGTFRTPQVGYPLLMKITGYSKDAISDAIQLLIKKRLIKRISGGKGREGRSVYEFVFRPHGVAVLDSSAADSDPFADIPL